MGESVLHQWVTRAMVLVGIWEYEDFNQIEVINNTITSRYTCYF